MAKGEKKETTLFCKVGRAVAQPLASSTDGATLDAVQQKKTAELLQSGVDLSRVEFTRE